MARRLAASGRFLAVVGLVTACMPVAEEVSPRPPVRSEVPMVTTLQSATEAALADAARRTGLDRSDLVVEGAESVTWPDGSLGCPQPGMLYTQALVPGYRIRIRAGGQLLDYHASARGAPFLCPPERATEPAPGAAT